jgi:hypothetical protein
MAVKFEQKNKEEESCCRVDTNSVVCDTSPDNNKHNCCTPQPKQKSICPKCNQKAKGVLAKTLKYILKDETKHRLPTLEGYHYCKTPSCEVIYFKNDEILTQDDLKVTVGLKEGVSPATLCYCFGWTKEKIISQIKKNGSTNALDDIKAKMKDPGCSCEIKNPSGSCCMGDVTKAVKEIQAIYI